MGIFKKTKMPRISATKDDNLSAMAITASHIVDAVSKDKKLTQNLKEKDWELIWSSLLFGALRHISTQDAIELTILIIQNSEINEEFKLVHKKVSTEPDEAIFYGFTPEHQRWLNSVNKQIWESAFEEGLTRHTNVNRGYIFEQVLPMVEHYVIKKANPLTDTHQVFTQIVASSISLAAEEIISQEPIFGLQATKERYGACQVVFALAIFLFNQRVE